MSNIAPKLTETQQQISPQEKSPMNGHIKIRERLNIIRNAIAKLINDPFQKLSETLMKTLRASNPNSFEKNIITDSVKMKYTPVLRDATILAILAVPGTMTIDSEAVKFAANAILTVTGVAWFTVSLKEVKEKFVDFGVEFTADMLTAFLTTLFLTAIISGQGIMQEELNWLKEIAKEAGIAFIPEISLQALKTTARTVTLLTGMGIIGRLVSAVIKFDATDAMLTGSADAARNYFENATSKLDITARTLRDAHENQSSNYLIVDALTEYLSSLGTAGELPEGLDKKVQELMNHITEDHSEFDTKTLPILKALLEQYQSLSLEDQKTNQHLNFIIISVSNLQKTYEKTQVAREYSDTVIANALETLSTLNKLFGDKLTT